MKYLTALYALAFAGMVSAQVSPSPTHPLPDDAEELNRTCSMNNDYNCIYLVDPNIEAHFDDPSKNYHTATRASGERIVVTGPGGTGHLTAHCNGGMGDSQLNFSFDRNNGNRLHYVRGYMNAQFTANPDNVVSRSRADAVSKIPADDFRAYCVRDS